MDTALGAYGYDMRRARAQPAEYARLLHNIATVLHTADPTAKLAGPDILNWSAPCLGCGGMMTGQQWTEQMTSAYVQDYGTEPPFDIWTIHTYPLNWQQLPTVNYALEEQQIVGFRQWLNGTPGLAGLPIWDTELGVHWGYTGYKFVEHDGQSMIAPTGELRSDEVAGYLSHMLSWFDANSSRLNIQRWFVYAAFNPDVIGDHAGAISLLDGPGPDAQLTPLGHIFVAAEQR